MHAIIAVAAFVLISAATWQIAAYEIAREQVSQAIANSITLDEAGTRLSETLVLSLLLDMLLLFLAWRYLSRWVLNPLEDIREQLREVTEGQLHAVIAVERPEELKAAARDAETMRQNLVEQIDQKRAAFESLNAQAPLALSIKAALEPNRVLMPQIDVFGAVDPAEGVIAGDWWDIVTVPGGVAVIAADVAGHGPAAGVAGLQLKAVLSAGLSSGIDPTDLFKRASDGLSAVDSLTATAIVCVIPDDAAAPVTYVSAGHPPARVVRHNANISELPSTGPMLGALGTTWTHSSIALSSGERIVMYSDGLVETRNSNDVEFGVESLDKILLENVGTSSHVAGTHILAKARQFSVTWNRDDVSLVILTRRLAV